MMAELGYAGQLELHEGKREIDFSSYGLKINVKFRFVQEVELSHPKVSFEVIKNKPIGIVFPSFGVLRRRC